MKLKAKARSGAAPCPSPPRDAAAKPRRALASRAAAGLRRRLPAFGRTGTGDLTDDEDPAAAPAAAAALTTAPARQPLPADPGPQECYAQPLPSPSNLDDVDGDCGDGGALAREVGRNAQEYLDECFDEEGAVATREGFAAIPQIRAVDLTILEHVGKGSFCDVCTVACKPPGAGAPAGPTFAMKRLRRQVCADADLFTMGAEDLVHETAILAGLAHPHIIKVHGRSRGPVANAFAQNGGYFLLLEPLRETLPTRLAEWRGEGGPRGGRLAVARPIADAVAYLHARDVVFRDLKPENVGFDRRGCVTLFDFGFAAALPDQDAGGLLYDRCGTPRYMAPEVGLERGYGAPADVYSFGILLWELCSLAKPFARIVRPEEFERAVFEGGERPELDRTWPSAVRRLVRGCWAAAPGKRPSMEEVKSSLSVAMASTDF